MTVTYHLIKEYKTEYSEMKKYFKMYLEVKRKAGYRIAPYYLYNHVYILKLSSKLYFI